MARILVLFSTVDGHTAAICERLRLILAGQGHEVLVLALDGSAEPAPEAFDRIVIGASIRYGRHRKAVFDFIERHRALLECKPSAFFSVNIVARKPEKCDPHNNPYMRKFLRQTAWRPGQLAVFAGRLDYPHYGAFDRFMIRLIMRITHGPTDTSRSYEFTDWAKVEAFGEAVGKL
jgi:menaquinone-dependent protoporphyrinogen oxidase